MLKGLRASGAMLLGFASILAISCDNTFGILSTIQGEKKQAGASIFQETAVFNFFRLDNNLTNTHNYYAVTGGTLQVSAVGQDSWSSVPIVSGSYSLRSAVLAEGAGISQPTIFALIETGGEANLSISVYYSTDGTTWTAVQTLPPEQAAGYIDKASTVESFDALYSANGHVYAEYHSYYHKPDSTVQNGPSTYTLYYFANNRFDNVATGFTPSPASDETIRGVVYDGTNYYWFASENHLYVTTDYTGGSDPTGETAAISPLLTTAGFSLSAGTTSGWSTWAISFTGSAFSDPAVYISTKSGYLLQYKNGATAASSSMVNTAVPLTQALAIPASSSGYSLVVGTDALGTTAAVGYYEGGFGSMVQGSGGSVAGPNAAAIFSTTVSIAPVHAFYYDTSTSTVFMCDSPGASSTAFYGLYASTWTSASGPWSGWSAQ
jgi:hypothetical protein